MPGDRGTQVLGSSTSRALVLLLLGSVLLTAALSGNAPMSPHPALSVPGKLTTAGASSAPASGAILPQRMGSVAPSIRPPTDGWLLTQGNVARNGTSSDPPPPTTNIGWTSFLTPQGTGSSAVTGGIVSSGNLVYAPSSDGSVYALNALNGTLAWSFTTGAAIGAAPELDRGLLLVASGDGYLYELNATSGALAVKVPLGLADRSVAPLPLGPNVVVPCQVSGAASLCEYGLGSTTLVWSQLVGDLLATPSADPVLDDLFVGNVSGGVLALAIASGAVQWNYSFGSTYSITTSPVVGPVAGLGRTMVMVYASAGSGGELAALNETSGTVSVRNPYYLQSFGFGIGTATPVLTSTYLWIATETGQVVQIDPATGVQLWHVQPWSGNANGICASPIDAEGTIVVAVPGSGPCQSSGSRVYELNAVTGQVLTFAAIPTGSVTAGMAITSTALYVGANDGTLYAIGTTPPSSPGALVATPQNRSVNLTWQAPTRDGGLPLGQYAIFWGVSGGTLQGTTVSPSTLSYLVPGLTNAATYTFLVEAVNSEGPSQNATATATPGALPWAPQGVGAVLSQHTFTLLWSAPASSEGLPVTHYVVHTWNASTWVHTNLTLGTSTSWAETGLPDGTEVFAQVAAVTSWGQGPFSPVVSGAPYLAPAVLALQVSPSAAFSSAQVSLQGPGLPGGGSLGIDPSNGSARAIYLPGIYWINITAKGYGSYDQQVDLVSGQVTHLNVTLQFPPRNPLSLSTLDIGIISAVAVVAIIVGFLLIARRARQIEEATGTEEEGLAEGAGLSEEEGPAAPTPSLEGPSEGGASASPEALGTGATGSGELSEAAPASSEPPSSSASEAGPSSEEEAEEAPAREGGLFGRLGRRTKAEKETLKNSDENTPEQERPPKQ